MKTNQAQTVPIHEHLIEQGFLEFRRSVGKGPLFYDAAAQAAQAASDPTNPQKPVAVKTREHLAAWVRKIGVTDLELSPNHSWRHVFKQVADRRHAGHAPAAVGRAYGAPTLKTMTRELARFPRFHKNAASSQG